MPKVPKLRDPINAYYTAVAREHIDLKAEEERPHLFRLASLRKEREHIILKLPYAWDYLFELLDEKIESGASLGPFASDFNNRKAKGDIVAKRVRDKLTAAKEAYLSDGEHPDIIELLLAASLDSDVLDALVLRAIKYKWDNWEEINKVNTELIELEQLLVKSNLKLSFKIANNMLKTAKQLSPATVISLEDLVSEANLALCTAIKGYNPNYQPNGKPIRFCTYAYWIIQSTVKQWIVERSRFIRLPKARVARILLLGHIMSVHDEATIEEVVERFNIKLKEIQGEENTKPTDLMNVNEALNLINVSSFPIEFNPHDDHSYESQNPIYSPEIVEQEQARAAVSAVVDSLSEVEQRIIRLKYYDGINSYAKLHEQLKEEGFNTPLESIKQIEQIALAKMKRNKSIRELKNEEL